MSSVRPPGHCAKAVTAPKARKKTRSNDFTGRSGIGETHATTHSTPHRTVRPVGGNSTAGSAVGWHPDPSVRGLRGVNSPPFTLISPPLTAWRPPGPGRTLREPPYSAAVHSSEGDHEIEPERLWPVGRHRDRGRRAAR